MSGPRETDESVAPPRRPRQGRRWRRKVGVSLALVACAYLGGYVALRETRNFEMLRPPDCNFFELWLIGAGPGGQPRPGNVRWAHVYRPCIAVELWWLNRNIEEW